MTVLSWFQKSSLGSRTTTDFHRGWDSPGKERDGLALWGAAARLQLRRRRCRDLAHDDGARSQLPGEPEHRRQQNTQRADHGRCVTASVRLRLGVADTARRAGAEVAGRGRAGLEQEGGEHGSRGTVVHRARVSEATQIAWLKSSDFATTERELRRGRSGAMTGPNRRSRGDAPLCRRRHALPALRERRGAGRQLAVPRGHPRHG